MRAGLGRSEITPPMGIELAGYGYYLERKAVSVTDPLFARALILEDGAKRALLVSCDLLGLSGAVCEEIRAYAQEKLGCGAEDIILVCTHTHTGPGIKHHEGCGETDPDFLGIVGGKICGAIDAALDDLKEVTALSFVTRELAGDSIYNRARAGGPVDRVLRGFILRRGAEKPVAMLSSACHGVFRQCVPNVSADYAGEVNRLAGEAGYASIYINGLCGDIDPYKPTSDRLCAYAAEICELLKAEEKELALTFSTGRIDFDLHHTEVSPESIHNTAEDALRRNNGRDPDQVRVVRIWEKEMLSRIDEVQEIEPLFADYLVLGGVPILALPVEGYTKIGMDIRAAIGRPDALILGCAEELMGYVPTLDDFERGSYAALDAPFLYKRLPLIPGDAERLGADLGEKMREALK